MIEIKKLYKSYNDLSVLKDINLKIKAGEIYGLIGESGVGKSTLLECINGLADYQKGSIEVDGVKVEELKHKDLRYLRKNIGMIFQNFSLLNRKNIYKNIALPMECWGFKREEINKKAKEYAEIVGLKEKIFSRPDELSGGQKQRVAIARALTLKPKYLLCDECTSALDPKTTGSILNLLQSIRKEMGITIVLVTHEMAVIKQLCDKMAIIENGTIKESGKVADLFLNKSPLLLDLLGEKEDLAIRNVGLTFSYVAKEQDNSILWQLTNQFKYQYIFIHSEEHYLKDKKYISITLDIDKRDILKAEEILKSMKVFYKISEVKHV